MTTRSALALALCLVLAVILLRQPGDRRGLSLSGVAHPAQADSYLIGTQPTEVPTTGNRAELWPGAEICSEYHDGAYDWCAPLGTEVHAPTDCTFLMQGEYHDNPRYGAYVICTTDGGLEIYVGHMDMQTANPLGFRSGDRIRAGQTIGYIGWHFIVHHVHAQLRYNGALVSADDWWWKWNNG